MNTKNYTPEEIYKIRYEMAQKMQGWLLSRGRWSEGMEVYRTPDPEIAIIKDVETGIKLGMRKEEDPDGVIIKASFFILEESEELDNL